jgi:hypothetical protein
VTEHNHVRQRLAAILALLVAAAGLAVVTAPSASAAPIAAPVTAPPTGPKDDEGGTKTLTDQLEAASTGYVEAQDALDGSKKRHQGLTTAITKLDAELAIREQAIGDIVNESYRAGRLGPMEAMLTAGSPASFLERATSLDAVASKQDRALRDVQESRTAQQQAKAAVDVEIGRQTKLLDQMAKRKSQAESALKDAQAGGDDPGPTDSGSGGGGGNSALAAPAPRSSDGSLPSQSCSLNDPTTTGCISPRTLHAMQEAKADGFTHFVSCFRPQGSGEHPKGKACDFAADKGGFGGVASGSSKDYGIRLANYFIANASRLGVLYVIWFKRIWLPSSGWKAYTRGNGDPSSDHTNHVHLSMR